MNKNQTVVGIVNILGSIASITGVSLLWLKGTSDISPLNILVISIVVSFWLGLATLAVIIIRYFYLKLISTKDLLVKVAFFSLASPVIVALMGMTGMLIGKLVSSSEFKWFFRM